MTREQIRARHTERTRTIGPTLPGGVCSFDGQSWPCDAIRALDQLDEAERHADADHATLARIAALVTHWEAQASEGDPVVVVEAALRIAAKRVRQVLGDEHAPATVDEVAAAIIAAWDAELTAPAGGHNPVDYAQAKIAATVLLGGGS